MNGKIKTLAKDKNYGFITPDEGDKDVFFHASSVTSGDFQQLEDGQAVTFEVEDSEKGPRAVNVVVA